MDARFGQLVHEYGPKERLYLARSKTILPILRHWKFNRPPDNERVRLIREHIEREGIVDGVIYVAQVVEGRGICHDCFDGNHRRLALEDVAADMPILVHVIIDASHDEIVKRFIALNQSHPVPELFMEEHPEQTQIMRRRETIMKLIELICRRWKKHLSTSRNPRPPNFSRTSLVDLFDQTLTLSDASAEQIFAEIVSLNDQYRDGHGLDHSSLKKNILEKCLETGCFVFAKNFCTDLICCRTEMSVRKTAPPVPQTLRVALWKRTFGDGGKGTCFVCSEAVAWDTFEAGHVVARSEGGATTLDNLKCICRTCNRSMGAQNLMEFKRKFFPQSAAVEYPPLSPSVLQNHSC